MYKIVNPNGNSMWKINTSCKSIWKLCVENCYKIVNP